MDKFISEKCYNDIVEMAAQMVAEEFIYELEKDTIKSYINKRVKNAKDAEKEFLTAKKEGKATRGDLNKYLNKVSKAEYAIEKGGQALHYSAKERNRSKRYLEGQKDEGLKEGCDDIVARAAEIIAEAILNETSSGLKKALLQGRAQRTREAQYASDAAHAKNAQIDADVLSHKVSDDALLKKVNTAKVDANLKAAKAKEKRANSLVNALENRPPKTNKETPKKGRTVDF